MLHWTAWARVYGHPWRLALGQGGKEEWDTGPWGTHRDTHRQREGLAGEPEVPNELFSQRKSPAALFDSRQHTYALIAQKSTLELDPRGPGLGAGRFFLPGFHTEQEI